ncbi:MAG: ABC transporter permease [Anaerolineales bacterium]|jgi:putative ABC transport system permease protein|nr:ABC transporter permease [Anaerolineales bacterium]MDX9938083.1 ABC transporter permease [Anaerolineales bacterium]GER81314.1 ABC transporter permease [Candidatus Denitrolinea symbiosum]
MKNFFLSIYLAVKEIVRNRGRFLLVSLVIALITLLVLFIAALGEGLGNSNKQYLANLDADMLVFLEKADFVIPSSRVDKTLARTIRRVDGVESAGIIAASNTAILLPNDEVLKVSILGIEPGTPGAPAVLEGANLQSELAAEVLIDRNVALRTDIKVGDRITIRSTQGTEDQFYELKVVGMTDGNLYQFAPSIFVTFSNWDKMRTKSDAEVGRQSTTVNVVAVKVKSGADIETVKANILARVSNVEIADVPTAIANVPGYSAQQSTVNTQAVFTLLIGILVIGGFFQIQVLQKVPQIGVMKAIGASNDVVGWASVIQIMVVTAIGVAIGGGLAYVFSLTFPPTVPIIFNGTNSLIAVIALLLIGPAGGLVSIIYAVRIEPLKALRLS